MKKNTLTNENVAHLAKLSALKLSDQEIEKNKKQLDETLTYIENLEELDVAKVSPMTHVSGQTNVFFEDGEECKRMLTQDEALNNSKKGKDGYVKVDRLI